MAAFEFKGGEALQAKLKELAAQVSTAHEVKVGFFEDATYPDGTPVAMIAAIQDFGAPAKNIPPRPFFRTMIKQGETHWGDDLGKILVAADYNAATALSRMGENMVGELQTEIRDWSDPPNAPRTIAAKGFNKPLVDTGQMLKSVSREVS